LANWQSAKLNFSPFETVRAPIHGMLSALEALEAILEALKDLVKAFLFDLSNPIKAIVQLLLAAVRALINQIKSAGFNLLFISPDFSRKDFSSILQSVSGSYSGFESKVVYKFHDINDIFRPRFPPGSSVAMIMFYLGSDNPAQLFIQINSLLSLIKLPTPITTLPAPVELTVKPVLKSSSTVAITQSIVNKFSNVFDGNFDQALVLEWRMPTTTGGAVVPGFLNSLVTFRNAFRFPNFLIERSESPTGESIEIPLNSQTVGKVMEPLVTKYGFPMPSTNVTLREENGEAYKHFIDKIDVPTSSLLDGAFTGSYQVTDVTGLKPGVTYYYRVRAYFGDITEYIKTITADDLKAKKNSLIFQNQNQWIIRYGKDTVMGAPSPVVRGTVPFPSTGVTKFDPYNSIYKAVQVGLLLNFELPPAQATDSKTPVATSSTLISLTRQDQKTGWGSLSVAGGQVGFLKRDSTTSNELKNNRVFKYTARRIANQVLTNLYSNTQYTDLLFGLWNDGVQSIVNKVLNAPIVWNFIGIVGGFSESDIVRVNNYLDKESAYASKRNKDGSGNITLDGPYPSSQFTIDDLDYAVNAESRIKLSQFLRSALAAMSGQASYMSWYSVTIGDLFPFTYSFIFDFDQLLLSLLKAVDSAVKEIEAIIDTILQKIRDLEAILHAINTLISLLNIKLTVSVFVDSSTNGSAESLVQSLINSGDKPSDSQSGFYSGMVMTFGGPGEGSLAAFKALKFLLTLGL